MIESREVPSVDVDQCVMPSYHVERAMRNAFESLQRRRHPGPGTFRVMLEFVELVSEQNRTGAGASSAGSG